MLLHSITALVELPSLEWSI